MSDKFEIACKAMEKVSLDAFGNDEKLEIYSLYKQGTLGDNKDPEPGFLNVRGKAKWKAWKAKEGMSQETAKQKYVELAKTYVSKEAQEALNK